MTFSPFYRYFLSLAFKYALRVPAWLNLNKRYRLLKQEVNKYLNSAVDFKHTVFEKTDNSENGGSSNVDIDSTSQCPESQFCQTMNKTTQCKQNLTHKHQTR
jgi:hypothetical protein